MTSPTGGPRGGRRRAVVVLAALLVAALATGAYLGVLSRAWSERAGELRATASSLGADLARTRADLEQRESELATAREQLQTARDRIVELADEKAQVGDDREAQRQLLDYQERVSAAAGSVATALQECVSGQARLIGYLQDADAYAPEELERVESEVDAFCDRAVQANRDLQIELSR